MNKINSTLKNIATGALMVGATIATQSIAGGVAGTVFAGILGNFAAGTIGAIKIKELKNIIVKPDPLTLNHDLEKLIKEALKWTISNIEYLYNKEFPQTDKRKLSKEIRLIISEIDEHVSIHQISGNEVAKRVDGMEDPNLLLESLFVDIENFPGLANNNEVSFSDFFKDKFPDNFRLCFGELLKKQEYRSALIVYNRIVNNNIAKAVEQNKEQLGEIKENIDLLLKKWDERISNNESIPELDFEINNITKTIDSNIKILIDQNGEILDKINSIYDEIIIRNKILDGITKIVGKELVIIQHFDSANIVINLNGEIEEIPNSLFSLGAFLENKETTYFKFQDAIHDINHFTEESFGYFSGKIPFNQLLTKSIIESIKNSCFAAGKFCEIVKNLPNWESEMRVILKAKEIIAYSFVGMIGKELSLLNAIGNERASEVKYLQYIEKCHRIILRTIDLLSFAQISILWDCEQNSNLQISEKTKQDLNKRFSLSFEPSIEERLSLLNHLIADYCVWEKTEQLPMPEISCLDGLFSYNGELSKACQIIQRLKEKQNPLVLDCYKAEIVMSIFFKHLKFLSEYKLVSMKRISYRHTKTKIYEPRYLHSYIALGLDNKKNIDSDKIKYSSKPVFTDSILLFKGDTYDNCINLYPLVVDYNAITLEQGSKVVFFLYQPIEGKGIEYQFVDDNSQLLLEHKGILNQKENVEDVFLTTNDFRVFNIDCVVEAFKELQKNLIGNQPDFGDL